MNERKRTIERRALAKNIPSPMTRDTDANVHMYIEYIYTHTIYS